MATATAILNTKYKGKGDTYPIVIRLIEGKAQKLHPTGWKVKEAHFKEGQVVEAHPDSEIINSVIDEELLKAKRYFAECRSKGIPIDLQLVFKEIRSHSFTGYLRHRSKQYAEAGMVTMRDKVSRFAKEFVLCFGRELYFSEITPDLLRTFDNWLKKGGEGRKPNVANTRAKKFDFLRKFYNNAIEEGKVHGANPFKSHYIKTTPVKKEKLTKAQVEAMEALDLSSDTAFVRDLWMFSYYCKGARFETCITMRKEALTDRLRYQINKGNKHLSTQVHPRLRAIIDRYIGNDTDTIFGRVNNPVELKKDPDAYKSKIGSENTMVNRGLKTIGGLLELPFDLTFHTSRHSFAWHLKQVTDNIHVIKESLGHSKTQTTEGYLKDLDDEHLDGELGKLYG